MWAQNSLQCKIDTKTVPNWICAPWSDEHMAIALGSGESFLEAISSALANLASAYQTEFMSGDKKNMEVIQKSKILIGNNIIVQVKIKQVKGVMNYSSEISMDSTKDLVFKKFISICEDGDKCSNFKNIYRINIVGSPSLNVSKELEKAGVKILKTYTDASHKQYVMIGVDKNMIRNQLSK